MHQWSVWNSIYMPVVFGPSCLLLWPAILPLRVPQFQFSCDTNCQQFLSDTSSKKQIWITTFLKKCRKYQSSAHTKSSPSFGHSKHITDMMECPCSGLYTGSLHTQLPLSTMWIQLPKEREDILQGVHTFSKKKKKAASNACFKDVKNPILIA